MFFENFERIFVSKGSRAFTPTLEKKTVLEYSLKPKKSDLLFNDRYFESAVYQSLEPYLRPFK